MRIQKIKNLLVITNAENKTNSIDLNTGNILGKKGTKVKNLSPDIKQYLYHNVHCNNDHEFAPYINALFDYPENIELLKFVDKMHSLGLIVRRYDMGELTRNQMLERLNAIKFDKKLVDHLKTKNECKVQYNVIQKFLKYSWLTEEQMEIFENFDFEREEINFEKEELLKFFEWYKYLVAHEYVTMLDNNICGHRSLIRNYIIKCKELEKTDYMTKNLLLNYCRVLKDYEINKNKIIDSKIKEWQQNKNLEYVSEKFTVIVPMTLSEMQDESNQQSNCIARSYSEYVANKRTHIVFLRLNSNLAKSYISIQVSNDYQVHQALIRHNQRPNSEDMALVNEYARYLRTVQR